MIIVDTSAWIFLFEKRTVGKNSTKAKKFYENNREVLVVTDLIIEETHKWLVHHAFPAEVASQILNKFVSEDLAQILPIEPHDRIEAQKLVEKYLDQTLSYTDAITVVLMRKNHIRKVFSFDSDFDLFRGIERVF